MRDQVSPQLFISAAERVKMNDYNTHGVTGDASLEVNTYNNGLLLLEE